MTKPIYSSIQKTKIKAFRHNIAVLKRKGLVSKKIDARSIKPSSHYNNVIKNFSAVLGGTATAVKLPKQLREQYKAVGYKSAFDKVLIEHQKGEKVVVTHGKPKTTNRHGIVKMDIPIPFHDLDQYLRDLKEAKVKKSDDERYGFRFYGNNSRHLYDDFDDMIAELQRYESTVSAIDLNDRAQMAEIFEGLTWYRIGNRKLWKAQGEKVRSEREKIKQSERRRRYNERMRENPTQSYLNFLENNKEASRRKYARMTDEQKAKRKKQMLENYYKKKGKK
jgi:hypothetical protein